MAPKGARDSEPCDQSIYARPSAAHVGDTPTSCTAHSFANCPQVLYATEQHIDSPDAHPRYYTREPTETIAIGRDLHLKTVEHAEAKCVPSPPAHRSRAERRFARLTILNLIWIFSPKLKADFKHRDNIAGIDSHGPCSICGSNMWRVWFRL